MIPLWAISELAFKSSRKLLKTGALWEAQALAARTFISPGRPNVTDCFIYNMNINFLVLVTKIQYSFVLL